LPIIGFLFRFSIPISLFFFIAGTFLISVLLVTDGIILNDRANIIFDNDTLFTISYEDNVMDFSFTGTNYQLKVIMVFIAVMLMVGGALTEVRKV
jgi:hypothetical protein